MGAKKRPKKKTGRPRKVINWGYVENLCSLHCTGEEIAAMLHIDYDTLQRAVKREYNQSFAEYFTEKSSAGKMSLRRRQYEQANSGNTTMLIWLGKQWLGQSDKLEQNIESSGKIVVNVVKDDGTDK